MGLRGRPPKPTKLKILTGNPGKRELNADEPQPDTRIPVCPKWLDATARQKWDELAQELNRLGLLTSIDGDALAGYCQAWSEFEAATKTLQEEERTYTTDKGVMHTHPAVSQQRSAMLLLQRFGAVLGLDPANRSRIKPPQTLDPTRQANSVSGFARKRRA